MLATTDDVIAALDGLIDRAHEDASSQGYFPCIYRRVTVAVKEAMGRGDYFDDDERMERFDVLFAQRYLDAVERRTAGRDPSLSWQAAFDEGNNRSLTVLQHLLLGMNAHISLDLGIAAVDCAGKDILSLKTDFFRINAILGSLIEDTERRLTRIFNPLGVIDRLLGPIDERLSIFSLAYARDRAWSQALELALAEGEAVRSKMIAKRDAAVARFAGHIVRPPSVRARLLLRGVRWLERGDVRWRLDCLR